MTLRAVVVDDEAPARAKLRRYLAEAEGVQWVGEAGDGREAVRLIQRKSDVTERVRRRAPTLPSPMP